MKYIYTQYLNNSKNFLYTLSNIYGIGPQTSNFLFKKTGLIFGVKNNQITNTQILNLNKIIKKNKIKCENNLKETRKQYQLYLESTKTCKINRFKNRLPVRGQRTHTNAKIAKKLNRM